MKSAGHVTHMEKMRTAYNISARKCEGKITLAGPRCTYKNNIKMGCRLDASGSVYEPVVSSPEESNEPSGSIIGR